MKTLSWRQTMFLKRITSPRRDSGRPPRPQDLRTAQSLIKQGMLDERGEITDVGRQALERARQEFLSIKPEDITREVINPEDVTLNILTDEDCKKITKVTFKASDVKKW